MRNEIQELFDDVDLFARQIANVQLENLSFDEYEFSDKSAMQVDLVFIKKGQLDNVQEIFSAIFKKQLFGKVVVFHIFVVIEMVASQIRKDCSFELQITETLLR